jgi:hypothetical protein
LFADAASDQLRILRTEIENDNCLGSHVLSVSGGMVSMQAESQRESLPTRQKVI